MSDCLLFLLNQTSAITPWSNSKMCQSVWTLFMSPEKKLFRSNYAFLKPCCLNELRNVLFYLTWSSGHTIQIAEAASTATHQGSFTRKGWLYWARGIGTDVGRLGTSSQQIKSGAPLAIHRVCSSIVRPIILKQAAFSEGGGQRAAPPQRLSKVLLTRAVYCGWHCTQGWLQEQGEKLYRRSSSLGRGGDPVFSVYVVFSVCKKQIQTRLWHTKTHFL